MKLINIKQSLKMAGVFALSLSTQLFATTTPFLDSVEARMRELAPVAENKTWNRSTGNQLELGEWYLQTPNCFGQNDCADHQSVAEYADRIEAMLAAAEYWVDITTLVPYPDGAFQRAIVSGIKQARERNPNLIVRILGGTPPGLGNFRTPVSESARDYLRRLRRDLGSDAEGAKIVVAGVETSWLYSWNHAKIIAVDGQAAIVGGHNMWETAYAEVPNPVADVSMEVTGPAALMAHRFADEMWSFSCERQGGALNYLFFVHVETMSDMACPATTSIPMPVEQDGIDILSIGGLGMGMPSIDGDEASLPAANDRRAACNSWFRDRFNNNRQFSVDNPDAEALRVLIGEAEESIFLSQQDLIAPCAPPFANAYYDSRLFDVLADKIHNNVKVRIVLSTPGSGQGPLAPYSNMKDFNEVTDILLRKLRDNHGMWQGAAKAQLCDNLQLAPLRHLDGQNAWSNDAKISNHAKVVAVDDQAVYVGSRNLYPSTLQEFGYVIENPAVMADFIEQYQNPMWRESKSVARVDYAQNICQLD